MRPALPSPKWETLLHESSLGVFFLTLNPYSVTNIRLKSFTRESNMLITMIGTGYVGLVTGACFAEMGHHVVCLDIDEHKIKKLNKGEIPIYEPGLSEIVDQNVKAKRLFFTTSYQRALRECKVCFIAVPTPSGKDGSCNTSYVKAAAKQIANNMHQSLIIVNKSTVPVGMAKELKTIVKGVLKQRKVFFDFDVVSNPEFLKEGSAVNDCMKPDRVVIGANRPKAIEIMKYVYSPFMLNHERLIIMDITSAELTKYAANAMLASRISFMNELSQICKKVGASIREVRKGIGSDSRIGYSFLYAGIGYGGSCFPKDIRALQFLCRQLDIEPLLLNAVDEINNRQKKILSKTIENYFSDRGGLQGKTIAVWGLSFKPDTDDMREAPSLSLIKELIHKGATLRLFDPIAMMNAKKMIQKHPNIIWCKDEFDAANGADAIALLTEWKQFRLLDFLPILKEMKGAAFFDGRNQYRPQEMKENGFDYIGIGIPDQIKKV